MATPSSKKTLSKKPRRTVSQELDHIEIRGAREHNLKSIDVNIPKKTARRDDGRLRIREVVARLRHALRRGPAPLRRSRSPPTRVSSSARWRSLATTRSAGSRRRSRSSRRRRATTRARRSARSPRSPTTCACSGRDVASSIVTCAASASRARPPSRSPRALTTPEGTKLVLLAPLARQSQGRAPRAARRGAPRGLLRLRVDGEIVETEGLEALDKRKKHNVEAVIDRLVVKSGSRRVSRSPSRPPSVSAPGMLAVTRASAKVEADRTFSEHAACAKCGISFPELTPQAFSFNSPQGMCGDCNGLGNRFEIDPDLVVPDDSSRSTKARSSPGAKRLEEDGWGSGFRRQILASSRSARRSLGEAPQKQREQILYGTGERASTSSGGQERRRGSSTRPGKA